MIEHRLVEAQPGLVFDISVAGAADAPLVLMLHGFAVSRHLYDAQLPALAQAGYFAAAPNQRGYSAGARPDPANVALYDIELLLDDAMAFTRVLGHGDGRFHLVGHDWGGSLAWEIASRHPERLASLTMLSRPHPGAFARALRDDPEQPIRSQHHKAFLAPDAVPKLLADDARWLRTRHAANGIPARATEKHLAVIGNPEAMEAALAWYRARGTVHRPINRITVPTLFIWGDADDTVGRMAAEGTADFIDAPYRFEVLPGVGHYAADQMPERVNALMLEHLALHGA
ncbi:alpha/beta fold hydrolase [Plastoroseomonas arctica]|uniref:Alpha/beta hydrolase n=1 Tax=Plastoroseomonas arctica TaxID=1509237 RepID=A0AAF1KJM4_9PROT|nr:alpha/beta fold hydrolase [Plastoroseomonas arctica]MBR0655455.1 alpha/beta hydrolase [Plastoroseomonas arctica]